MITSGMKGVDFIAINTDAQDLDNNPSEQKVQIGKNLTKGLGAGANSNVGKDAVEADKEAITALLEGANMVEGVSNGFTKKLEIVGVGSRAQVKGKTLVVSAGYSHPVEVVPPEGITFKVENNTNVIVTGPDKELVGNEAAKIRAIRPPEPYKGKGIKYEGEQIIRKAGKSGKA